MKILILSPKPPFPAKDGSSLATAQVIAGMAGRGHTVHVFFLNTSKHNSTPADLPHSPRIIFHPARCDTSVKPLPAITSLLSSLPYTVSRFISAETQSALKKTLEEGPFDILQIEGLMMTPYLDLLPDHPHTRIVFRPHNTEYLIWSHLAREEKNLLRKSYFHLLTRQILKYEKRISRRFRYLLPISEQDAKIFRTWNSQACLQVLPYGIDLPEEAGKTQSRPAALLFLGALDWRPNIQGLEWFLNKVWPPLSKRFPDLFFHIAGRNPDLRLKEKIEHHNPSKKIIFHGEVDNTVDLFDRSTHFIVPLFAGSGIRIKILEAISRGMVVISTPTGAAGLPLGNNEHILLAKTPEEFLITLSKAVEDTALCSTIQQNALHLLKTRFDRKNIILQLEKFYLQA